MSFGIDDAIAAGMKVLDKFVPDPEAKAKAETANNKPAIKGLNKVRTVRNMDNPLKSAQRQAARRPIVGLACEFQVKPALNLQS